MTLSEKQTKHFQKRTKSHHIAEFMLQIAECRFFNKAFYRIIAPSRRLKIKVMLKGLSTFAFHNKIGKNDKRINKENADETLHKQKKRPDRS